LIVALASLPDVLALGAAPACAINTTKTKECEEEQKEERSQP
jgi:hypothetical protein